jgi:hypothetical protein
MQYSVARILVIGTGHEREVLETCWTVCGIRYCSFRVFDGSPIDHIHPLAILAFQQFSPYESALLAKEVVLQRFGCIEQRGLIRSWSEPEWRPFNDESRVSCQRLSRWLFARAEGREQQSRHYGTPKGLFHYWFLFFLKGWRMIVLSFAGAVLRGSFK